jgi:RNA polymerase-binding transcription factor DksA
MAKTKKTKAKAAKKAVKAKVKKATAKKATPKKAAPKKAAKKAPKKVVAKKAAPKKAAPKKPVAKKAIAPKAKPVAKKTPVKKVAPVKVKEISVEPPVVKVTPPQLNIFPVLNQRPIAHKPAKSASVNEDKTRYSDEELKEFETLILEKLEKARGEYKILKDTLSRDNDSGTDSTSGGNTKVLEDGAETAEKENLSQLAARQQKYITNLENALVRIKNGTYGICSVTGKLISKERLIAVPHTTQSIEAKMMKQD